MIEAQHVSSDDWRLWRDLRRAALAEAPEAFGSTLAQWSGAGDTEDRWRRRLDAVAASVVLWLDGTPAGMVSAATASGGDAVELISLWVAPGARGRGVGDAAIEAVIAWAAENRPGQPVMLAVRRHNRAARALYRRHGFVDAGPSAEDPDEDLMLRPG